MNRLITPKATVVGKVESPSFFSRYREVFVAIALFLALDVSVLVLNYYTASQLGEDSLSINLAGRQRMLSQRITKCVLSLHIAQGQNSGDLIKELNTSYDLFDTTLKAFDLGGFATDADGKTRSLVKVTDPDGRAALEDAKKIWENFQPLIRPLLLSADKVIPEQLAAAETYIVANNKTLLGLMNKLTVALEKQSEQRTQRLRIIQAGALVLIILNFAFIIYDFITKIRRGDNEVFAKTIELESTVKSLEDTTTQLSNAKADTDAILQTVRQGLFLINSRFEISGQYSEELKGIFRKQDLAEVSLLKLLQNHLTEKDYHPSRDFLEMLFDARKKEKTLQRINPLAQAELHFQEKNASFTTFYYEFQFRRIVSGDKVERVFLSVRDITPQVEMTRQLKEAEERKERQISLLLDLVNVSAEDVNDFCKKSAAALDEINLLLRAEDFAGASMGPTQDKELRKRLDNVFRTIHGVKGHAAALGIGFFVDQAHKFEDGIDRLKSRPKLAGEDFMGIVTQLAQMKLSMQECQDLREKLGKNVLAAATSQDETAAKVSEPPVFDPTEKCQNLVQKLSRETGREATIRVKPIPGLVLSPEKADDLQQILFQFIRNSFAHAIEPSVDRVKAGKGAAGVLHAELIQVAPDKVKLEYGDDGKGLDVEKIKRRCIDLGLVSPDDAPFMKASHFWRYIFEPGFTTSNEANHVSGRGIGLDLVRHLVTVKNSGQLSMSTEPGKFTKFFVTVPTTQG